MAVRTRSSRCATQPSDLRYGLHRVLFNWLLIGALEDRLGLSPAASVLLGDRVPGCHADVFVVHADWSISVVSFLPDDPEMADAEYAVDRLDATDESVLRRMNVDMALNDRSINKIIVSPGICNAQIAAHCLDNGASYISTGFGIAETTRMRWLS